MAIEKTDQNVVLSFTVNGKWTKWGLWSVCSVSCGVGVNVRRRSCTNPAPAFGGNNCTGESMDVKDCIGKSGATCSGKIFKN